MNRSEILFLSGLLITFCSLPMSMHLFGNVVRGDRLKSREFFITGLYMLVASLWGVGSMLVSLPADPGIALEIWKFAYVGVLFIPVLYLHSVVLLGEGRRARALRLSTPLLVFAYLQATIFAVATWSDALFQGAPTRWNGILLPVGGSLYSMSFGIWVLLAFLANCHAYQLVLRASSETKVRFRMFSLGAIAFLGGVTNFLPIIPELRHCLWLPVPYGNLLIPLGALLQYCGIYFHNLIGPTTRLVRSGLISTLRLMAITGMYIFTHSCLESFLREHSMKQGRLPELGAAAFTFAMVDPMSRAIRCLVITEGRRRRTKERSRTKDAEKQSSPVEPLPFSPGLDSIAIHSPLATKT